MKKLVQKLFITLLILVLITSMIMTGCSTNGGGEQTTNGTTGQPAASKQETQQTELKPVNLIWYISNTTPANSESVFKKANEIIGNKINATVDFRFIGGDFGEKMKMVMAASEEYDITFTSSWNNDYTQAVNKGAYIPLDDYLVKYPALKGLMRDTLWESVKIGGKIYAVPNLQVMYYQYGIWFRKDLVDKYALDVGSVKKTADLTPIFQKIKDNEPDIYPLAATFTGGYFVKNIPSFSEGMGVDPTTWKVYDRRSTDYVENYKVVRDWYLKGFMPPDAATMKDKDSLIKAGKVFSRYTRTLPGVEAEIKQLYGLDAVVIQISEPVISRDSVLSTLNAISVTSKNPDRAIMLLDLINTDKELYNTMVFGLEGQDYKKISENRIETIPEKYSAPSWQLGNQFNAYLMPGQTDDVWEVTKKMNDDSKLLEMGGFSFDSKNVESQMAQIHAINTEYDVMLNYGLDDTEVLLKKRADKLKLANFDKFVEEMQRQVDEWVKANVK